MNSLQAFAASLARSRAQAHAAFAAAVGATHASPQPAAATPGRPVRATHASPLPAADDAAPTEYITIHPPVWCHACGRMLVASAPLRNAQINALCPDCAAKEYRPDRRRHGEARRLRELIEITRLLAWHIEDSAGAYADRGCPETARVMREMAAAANTAIEAMRTTLED